WLALGDRASSPTRRSSDLAELELVVRQIRQGEERDDEVRDSIPQLVRLHDEAEVGVEIERGGNDVRRFDDELGSSGGHRDVEERSEEHTSELQSRFDLVCR